MLQSYHMVLFLDTNIDIGLSLTELKCHHRLILSIFIREQNVGVNGSKNPRAMEEVLP